MAAERINSPEHSIAIRRTIAFCAMLVFGVSWTSLAQRILVPPYLQPGNAPSLKNEQKVVLWQTDSVPGVYKVEFGEGSSLQGVSKVLVAKVNSVQLNLKSKTTLLYRAQLTGLHTDSRYAFRVKNGENVVYEGSFETRTRKPQTRFVAFGDCGAGTPQQAAIAYQMYQQKPQFALVTGDIAYVYGTENDYRQNFFPPYLAPAASPEKGAPLMNTLPFYMILGNHDVAGSNFDKRPDGLAYFYYNDLPLNAPVPELTLTLEGAESKTQDFKKINKGRFPRMSNFSFDYGNVHITCLDANDYVNPLDQALVEWLREDIKNSSAEWKIVAYHQPAFNSSKAHYNEQWMRLLSPLLEELKVDLVLNGHVHDYQRTLPLTFAPKKNQEGTLFITSKDGKVDGTFALDKEFDGITKTKPKGIIYIVTGAGGGGLYDVKMSGNPDLWTHEPAENWVPFTTKLISNTHSFTLIETAEKELVLKQLDAHGTVLDEIKITH